MILALDLATEFGYATATQSGAIKLRKKVRGEMFHHWDKWLADQIDDGVNIIAYEKVRRHLSADSAHVYGGLEAFLLRRCYVSDVTVIGIEVSTLKKSATGTGKATKDQMISAANILRGGNYIDNHNEADAVCLYHVAVGQLTGNNSGNFAASKSRRKKSA